MRNRHGNSNSVIEMNQLASSTVRHYTANTGHLAITPRSAIGNDVVKSLLPLVHNDGGCTQQIPDIYVGIDRGSDADQVRRSYSTFRITSAQSKNKAGKLPWVVGVGCWNDACSVESWAVANDLAHKYLEIGLGMKSLLPTDAPKTPWLSVVLLPSTEINFFKYLYLLGDLERCLFWTLAESEIKKIPSLVPIILKQ